MQKCAPTNSYLCACAFQSLHVYMNMVIDSYVYTYALNDSTCGHMHLLTPMCTHVHSRIHSSIRSLTHLHLCTSISSHLHPCAPTDICTYLYQPAPTSSQLPRSTLTNSPQMQEHSVPAAFELQNCRQLLQRSELGQGQA